MTVTTAFSGDEVTMDKSESMEIQNERSRSFISWAAMMAVVLSVAFRWTTAAHATPGDESAQILQATGIKGGLVVHLGCADGKLTAALRASESYLVHGLDSRSENVIKAREYIQSLGAYGPVSVDSFDGKHLPYADSTVNLVVASGKCQVASEEIARVLAPNGVALVLTDDPTAFATRHSPLATQPLTGLPGWSAFVKPRPEDIDEWTHFLYDASGTAVSKDRQVAPPKRLQWVAEPRWCRSHEFPSSVNAVVSADGRVFYILDEGPLGVYKKLPQSCSLIARDASNGLLLWKQPMREWSYEHGTGLGDRWHIHHTLPRRLVAHGDKVYLTLSFRNSPVSILDAATGAILTEGIEGTEGTDEILYADGILVAKSTDQSQGATKYITQKDLSDSLAAVDAETGSLLWRKDKVQVAPYALAVKDDRVVYHNMAEIVCLDAKTGRELWRVANDVERIPGAGSTLVISEDVVLYHSYRHETKPGAGRRGRKTVAAITALGAEDGQELWTAKGGIGWAGACTQPTDVFVANGLVWCGQSRQGRDLRTGEVRKTLDLGKLISPGHHPRCYRSKATESFLIWPKRGAEFIDLDGDEHMRHNWLRAPCFAGVMPANGLLYVPPSQCFCYPGVKLSGFLALAAEEPKSQKVERSRSERAASLERGPAYDQIGHRPSAIENPSDWPMYRHDPLRSGAAKGAVPTELTKLWEVTLSREAAQPIVVGDRLFVAEKDAHRIRCLDARDGRAVWAFTAGGRIDSAPTVHDGLVLFGCRDGWVYCLRADDGKLVWRFHAAPAMRRVMSFGQLESPWPVHGSVLVQDDVVYFTAGRSSYLDGGIVVHGLNPRTGEVFHRALLEGPWPDIATESGGPFWMEGAKSDLFVSDGQYLYMQRIKFDGELNRIDTPQITTLGDLDMGGRHLLATGGFLDDSGFDRLFWVHGKRWPGFYFAQQAPKSGQIIVFDEQTTYTVKYFYRRHGLSPGFIPADIGYLLFADDNDNEPILVDLDGTPKAVDWLPTSARGKGRYDISARSVGVEKGIGYTRSKPPKWQELMPIRARAMMLAGDHLFVAGAPDVIDPEDPYATLDGRKGAVLQVFSASDGALLKSYPLASPPVFDGMSAANNRLFMAALDGRVVCMGSKN